MPSQTERRDATRRALVAAALAACSRAGNTEFSLDQVARDAGVAKATLLYHFGSRQGLLRAVAVQVIGRLEADITARGGHDLDGWMRAVLEEQLTPNGRVLYEIGDELTRHGALDGSDPMGYLVARLRGFGVEDAEVVAAAVLQFGRQLAFGSHEAEEVDRLLGLLDGFLGGGRGVE